MRPLGTRHSPAVLAVAVLLTVVSVAPVVAGEHDDLLRTVADGYRANRDAFPYLVTRSIITQGKVDSLDKVLGGQYPSESSDAQTVAKGYYALDAGKYRHDLIYPPELQEKFRVKVSDHQWTTSFVSEREAANGLVFAKHFPDSGQASVRAQEGPNIGFHLGAPFNMGMIGNKGELELDRLIEQSFAKGGTPASYDGEEVLDGRRTWVVTCRYFTLSLRFWVDPERGFLPIRIHQLSEGQPSMECRLLEIASCSRGRWLPVHGLTVFLLSKSFRATRITEFEVDDPPAPEALRLDLPPRTGVIDTISDASWAPGKGGRASYLDPDDYVEELKRLQAQAQAEAPAQAVAASAPKTLGPFPDTPSPTIQTRSGLSLWSIAAGVGALLVLAGFSWRRFRHRA